MKWVMLLVAFVVGGGTTWLLTVHRVTRSVPVDGGRSSEREPDPDAARFGGAATTSSVDTHGAGARWMADAEDEDALLHPHDSLRHSTRDSTPEFPRDPDPGPAGPA